MMLNLSDCKYRLKPVIILITCFLGTYFPVWKSLVSAWYGSDDYSHGFFIVPLCIYIVGKKRQLLATTKIKPSTWGLVLVLFSLLVYLVAYFGEIATLASFSMVPFLAGVIIYFYGFGIFKELLFPFFMLLFMIPVPAQIYATLTVPLQLFVSKSSTWFGPILGMPIYREGNVIHLPEHTLQVVHACSGLRSMISLMTLSAVFAYFTLKSNTLRTILFLSGIPAAIVVNIIRVLMMIFMFYYFNYDLTESIVHTIIGVIIFVLALLIIAITRGVLSNWDMLAVEKLSS
jgi:exosortase A